MDRRVTIALVAILVVLGGYIYWTQLREGADTGAPITPQPTRVGVIQFDTDAVTRVEVKDKNAKTTRVVKQGDTWTMETPAQGPANPSRVDGFLFQLSNLDASRSLPNPGDLASFSLATPSYTVTLALKDGTEYVIKLGDQNPDKSQYYALKGTDTTVYLIPSNVGEAIKDFVEMPPYTPTPTNTSQPTETPTVSETPTPGGTPEPTGTGTPTP